MVHCLYIYHLVLGNTPLIRINSLSDALGVEVLVQPMNICVPSLYRVATNSIVLFSCLSYPRAKQKSVHLHLCCSYKSEPERFVSSSAVSEPRRIAQRSRRLAKYAYLQTYRLAPSRNL